jgi:primosomal protein N'
MIVQVSPSLNIFEPLSYNYRGDPALLKPGVRVVVPLGNRFFTGWITETHSQYKGRVKDIIAVVRDDYTPGSQFMAFVRAVSHLYFASMGSLLDYSLPPGKKQITALYFENRENQEKVEKLNRYSAAELQRLAKDGTIECFYKADPALQQKIAAVEGEAGNETARDHRFLIGFQREIHYRQMMDDCLSRGKSVLITVPDNLTAAYLKEKLGEVDIYSSELKPKERETLWHDYSCKGKTGVLVGGLSAAFLPIQNLGLVVCDRAGSPGYKRRSFSRYDVQVLSQLRAKHFNIPLVEGFSTATVQAYQNPSQVKIEDKREEQVPVEVRMIKSRTRRIPGDFQELMSSYFSENKKVLVILNKKESANFLFCEKCKKIQGCPSSSCEGLIDVEVEGDEAFHIKCRRCGLEKEAHNQCPKCGEALHLIEDVSIASVKKFVKTRVVETGITSLSSEGLKQDHLHSVLKRVGESKVVIATPVIVNPFFNNMFDVIIYLRPESFFNLEEYDAAEKVFSLVSEFRELVKPGGSIDIFSTFHFHYSLKLINDEAGFFDRELKYREWFHLPPFFNVYHIEVRGKELRKLAAEMRGIFKKFKEPLKIKRIYLASRLPSRGMYKYKGILEAHAQPGLILESGLLKNRDISIDLVLI